MKKILTIVLAALVLLGGAVFASGSEDGAPIAAVATEAREETEAAENVADGAALNDAVNAASDDAALESAEGAVAVEAGAASSGKVKYEICHHFITLNANPYAFQHIGFHNDEKFNSDYGFGVNTGYRYSFGLFNAGLEVGYSNFKYDEYDRYHILSFTGLGGISYHFTPKFFGDFDLGAGLDIRFVGDEHRANFSAMARLGAGYWLTDLIAITGGADLKLAWQSHETDDLKSTDLGVYVNVGTKISL